jgi:hypothetical protein
MLYNFTVGGQMEDRNFEVDFKKVVRAYSTLHKVFIEERKSYIDLVDIRNIDKIVLPRVHGAAYYHLRNNPLRDKARGVITVDDFNTFEVVDTGGKGRVKIGFITNNFFGIGVYIVDESSIGGILLWEEDRDAIGMIADSVFSIKTVKDVCNSYWKIVNKLPYDLGDFKRRLIEDHYMLGTIRTLSSAGATVMTILYLMFNFSDKFSITADVDKKIALEYIRAIRDRITGFGDDIPSAVETMAIYDVFAG